MKRNSDTLSDPIDANLTVSQDKKKKKINDSKNASVKNKNANLEFQDSPIFPKTEKSMDSTIDKFLFSLRKMDTFQSGGLFKDSPNNELNSQDREYKLLSDSFGIPSNLQDNINKKLELSFKDIRNNRKAAKKDEKEMDDFSKKIESKLEVVTSNSSEGSLRESDGPEKRSRPLTSTLPFSSLSSGAYKFSRRRGLKNDLNQRIPIEPSLSENFIEPNNENILKDLSGYYPPVLKLSRASSENPSSKKTFENMNEPSFDSNNFGISFTLASDTKGVLTVSNAGNTPGKQLDELKPPIEDEIKKEDTKAITPNKSATKYSVTKIDIKRRSVAPKSPTVTEPKKRDDSARKSVSKTPPTIDPALYRELQDENEKLKKEFQRKQKETENLKREKEVLLRKVKVIEAEKKEVEEEKDKALSTLNTKDSEYLQIKNELIKSEVQRAHIHNYLQELRGNLRIFCRVKPINQAQRSVIAYPEKDLLNVKSDNFNLHSVEIGTGSKKLVSYFDRVFDETSTNKTIFEEIVPFVQSAIDGNAVSILAYGQTGSGKTYTMEGPNLAESKSIEDSSGILPRAVAFIFEEIKRLEFVGIKIEIKLSCLEIYNDSLTDLLAEPSGSLNTSLNTSNGSQDSQREGKLVISFHNGKVSVSNLTWITIKETQQLFAMVTKASSARAVDKTSWNERSSRSHCIYRIKLCNQNGNDGLLTIVDLAGSERCDPKLTEKVTPNDLVHSKKIQTEANHINKSLTTLGRIVRLISEKSNNAIPYRESKLTRLLQDSLGGHAKTLMFINICPSEEDFNQSKESLKFSTKALL